MSISDYQYERLTYLIENQELSLSELQMIHDILSRDWSEDKRVMVWLLSWLRKKPRRNP
jgi:DNA-binding response OmpR family regulator